MLQPSDLKKKTSRFVFPKLYAFKNVFQIKVEKRGSYEFITNKDLVKIWFFQILQFFLLDLDWGWGQGHKISQNWLKHGFSIKFSNFCNFSLLDLD